MTADRADAVDLPGLERFARLSTRFGTRWNEVRHLDHPAFVREDWRSRNEELARDLSPAPPADFLQHPAIRFQMFVADRYLALELPYVAAQLGAPEEAREDAVGGPPRTPLDGSGVLTSANTVHQLHHLLRYEEHAGRRLADSGTIVEWGAGYGNLAKLIARRHFGRPTMVLLDTPVFSCLQWLYLASTLGEDDVVLHSDRGQPLTEGAVNVVPIGLLDDLEMDADLFISTWALNESAPAAQAEVIARDWFGAPALLLAMHEGDPLEAWVLEAGARRFPVGPFMPAQRYFVR